MNYEEFLKLVHERRNIRKYKSDPVADEDILKIIECARWAQSGGNGQPWEFIIVKDQVTKERIVEIEHAYHEMVWQIERTRVREIRHLAYLDGPPTGLPGFRDAPVIIVVLGDRRTAQASILATHFLHNEGGPDAHFLKNMANATQIMQLAAASLGLASMWLSVNEISEGPLRKLLDIPEELAIHTLVPVGYAAIEPKPVYRRGLEEIIHYEKYDRTRFRTGGDIYQFLVALRRNTASAYSMFNKKAQDKEGQS